jgi:hypothetical protein
MRRALPSDEPLSGSSVAGTEREISANLEHLQSATKGVSLLV